MLKDTWFMLRIKDAMVKISAQVYWETGHGILKAHVNLDKKCFYISYELICEIWNYDYQNVHTFNNDMCRVPLSLLQCTVPISTKKLYITHKLNMVYPYKGRRKQRRNLSA